jgi:hypothetical protein
MAVSDARNVGIRRYVTISTVHSVPWNGLKCFDPSRIAARETETDYTRGGTLERPSRRPFLTASPGTIEDTAKNLTIAGSEGMRLAVVWGSRSGFGPREQDILARHRYRHSNVNPEGPEGGESRQRKGDTAQRGDVRPTQSAGQPISCMKVCHKCHSLSLGAVSPGYW